MKKTAQELLQERAQLVEQQAALVEAAKAEERTLTEAEQKQFDDLDAKIEELDKEIEAAEAMAQREAKVAARKAGLDDPASQPYRPRAVGPDYSQNNRKKDDAGFKNLGEFVAAVRFGDPKGRLNHLRTGDGENGGIEVPEAFKAAIMPWRYRNEWTMETGEEGGFAVPTQFRQELLMIRPEAAIVRPRATVIPAGDPPDSAITLPAYRQGSNGVFGGVTVTWVGEGKAPQETDGKMDEIMLQPREAAADTVVTDKLLRNWEAASSFISTLLRNAIMNAEDFEFLRGNGVAKPIGAINGDGALVVKRGAANDITYTDIVNMEAKMLPESSDRAIWIANQSTLPKIATLQDGNGNYIFIRGDATRGIPDTLHGRPIRFTGKTPPLGQKGDLILVDFTYYLIKDGSGPFVAASEHVLFRQNKTVIKVVWNVDGKGWVKAALTLEDGSTQVSPYVVLDVPAA